MDVCSKGSNSLLDLEQYTNVDKEELLEKQRLIVQSIISLFNLRVGVKNSFNTRVEVAKIDGSKRREKEIIAHFTIAKNAQKLGKSLFLPPEHQKRFNEIFEELLNPITSGLIEKKAKQEAPVAFCFSFTAKYTPTELFQQAISEMKKSKLEASVNPWNVPKDYKLTLILHSVAIGQLAFDLCESIDRVPLPPKTIGTKIIARL